MISYKNSFAFFHLWSILRNVFNPSQDLREKCGIFGVYGKELEAARLVHSGLWALQHRGQEGSGVAASDGEEIRVHKGTGLVAHVYNEANLDKLLGFIAIGHNRYSTSGPSVGDHAQPVVTRDKILALAHNGNLPSIKTLETFLKKKGIPYSGHNDSELMHLVLTHFLVKGVKLEIAVKRAYPLFTGAFSLLLMTKDKLVAVRDSKGIRPLSFGKINGSGYAFSSETCALDTIGAKQVQDVKPGEMVVVSKSGVKKYQLEKGEQKLDIFEFVYFARPDSELLGVSINEARRRMGIQLAKEYKVKADVVIPIPDSAIPAALGYSQQSGIPFDHGLIKNRYIHRTFIRPAQKLRDKDIQMKLNPLPEVIRGKRVVVIDDSIVRGTTSKKIVSLLREAGVKEVHFLSSSPPVRYPDFYGIDTPRQEDLIASKMTVPEVAEYMKADSVYYLSYKGLVKAIGLPEKNFCTSCFTGEYPIDLGERWEKVVCNLHVGSGKSEYQTHRNCETLII